MKDLYPEYESTIRKFFANDDEIIAKLIGSSLNKGNAYDKENIFGALSWASGNLITKFPKVADALMEFVEKYNKSINYD